MYTGTVPTTFQEVADDLTDLQSQITANLNTSNKAIAGLQTQIKQVTLTLEGELHNVIRQFDLLEEYVKTNLPA